MNYYQFNEGTKPNVLPMILSSLRFYEFYEMNCNKHDEEGSASNMHNKCRCVLVCTIDVVHCCVLCMKREKTEMRKKKY